MVEEAPTYSMKGDSIFIPDHGVRQAESIYSLDEENADNGATSYCVPPGEYKRIDGSNIFVNIIQDLLPLLDKVTTLNEIIRVFDKYKNNLSLHMIPKNQIITYVRAAKDRIADDWRTVNRSFGYFLKQHNERTTFVNENYVRTFIDINPSFYLELKEQQITSWADEMEDPQEFHTDEVWYAEESSDVAESSDADESDDITKHLFYKDFPVKETWNFDNIQRKE